METPCGDKQCEKTNLQKNRNTFDQKRETAKNRENGEQRMLGNDSDFSFVFATGNKSCFVVLSLQLR